MIRLEPLKPLLGRVRLQNDCKRSASIWGAFRLRDRETRSRPRGVWASWIRWLLRRVVVLQTSTDQVTRDVRRQREVAGNVQRSLRREQIPIVFHLPRGRERSVGSSRELRRRQRRFAIK